MSQGVNVLVVEDEEIVAGLIQLTLTEYGHKVKTVADGHSAWQALKSGATFDAILLDRGLPDTDASTLSEMCRNKG